MYQVITKKEFATVFGPASMHAIGHIAANLSFAAVAISLTHTVKTLEPAFNVVLMKVLLGESTPLPAVLSLIPIMVSVLLGDVNPCTSSYPPIARNSLKMTDPPHLLLKPMHPRIECKSTLHLQVGVGLASAGELSFNWMGFLTAMASNLTFGFRAVWSKMAMSKTLGGTALYAYTTLISVIICVPLALLAEGSTLIEGGKAAIAQVGAVRFWGDLFAVGLLYHLYNQVGCMLGCRLVYDLRID